MKEIKIECEFHVVGGPNDGLILKYSGTTEDGNWASSIDAINFKGHTYKIIDFNPDLNSGTIMW